MQDTQEDLNIIPGTAGPGAPALSGTKETIITRNLVRVKAEFHTNQSSKAELMGGQRLAPNEAASHQAHTSVLEQD